MVKGAGCTKVVWFCRQAYNIKQLQVREQIIQRINVQIKVEKKKDYCPITAFWNTVDLCLHHKDNVHPSMISQKYYTLKILLFKKKFHCMGPTRLTFHPYPQGPMAAI